MAHDDYFVIVYQVLKYLYDCLKKGKRPEIEKLMASYYSIPDTYWSFIIVSLVDKDLIKGIVPMATKTGTDFNNLQDTMITPKGIEYLFDSSLQEKVRRTLENLD